MTEVEKQALEREFADIYDLIDEINDVSARLLSRAEEARQALGLPPKEGEGDPDARTADR